MDIVSLMAEVEAYLDAVKLDSDGEHLWSNYQEIVAMTMRLQQIHNDIAFLEATGEATTELKKFRTGVLDPTIERLDKAAAFESRKITGKKLEAELEKGY